MKYLFQVNIGPIQGFIASARRTRDLKFGSWLLSELAKVIALKITEIYELGSLIFPAPENNESLKTTSLMNVANKIVAVIDDAKNTPEELGHILLDAVKARLREIQDEVYTKIEGKEGKDFDKDTAVKQVEDLIEFFWVAVPFVSETYEHNRRELEAIMAARKNTRNFSPVGWGSNHRKSSIDGQLESVIPEKRYSNHKDNRQQKMQKANDLYTIYGAGPAEHLSGVDLLKRHGLMRIAGEPDAVSRFPSTSHVAALPFLARLDALESEELKEAKKQWNKYTGELKRIAITQDLETVPKKYNTRMLDNLDGSLLFEERFVDVVDVVDADDTKKDQIKKVRHALREFYNSVDKKLGKARPYPYYAILLADGDNMGKTIDHLAGNKNGEKKHRELSQALDVFSNSVEQTVREHNGALVYAGGDDVLAFVPLCTVRQCASELAVSFKSKLQEFAKDEKDAPTLSVGVAVVHHLEPLQDALELARTAEAKAKNVSGKNALAIIVRKRGGGEVAVAGKWGNLDSHLERLVGYYYEDAIPDGTAYELRDLSQRLTPPSMAKQDAMSEEEKHREATLQEVVLQEAKRILHRKLHGPQGKRTSEVATNIEAGLLNRLGIPIVKGSKTANNEGNETAKDTIVSLPIFINELLVAQTFTEVKRIAEYTPNKKEKVV